MSYDVTQIMAMAKRQVNNITKYLTLDHHNDRDSMLYKLNVQF